MLCRIKGRLNYLVWTLLEKQLQLFIALFLRKNAFCIPNNLKLNFWNTANLFLGIVYFVIIKILIGGRTKMAA